MNSPFRHFTTVLLAIAALAIVGVTQAHAATVVETEGNPPKTWPVERWIAEMKFPTPDVKIRVAYGPCPGQAGALACAGGLNGGVYNITINPERMDEFPTEFNRSTVHHEVGHVVDAAYFGDQTRRDLVRELGYPKDRTWYGDLDNDKAAKPTWIEPAEWFAEAYSACEAGASGTDVHPTYGFKYTYRQLLPICNKISVQMSGRPLTPPPSPRVPVLCSPSCQKKLGVNDRFVAQEKLVPGTVSAVVRYGKKAAMLERGCKGKVKIAGDTVYLNYCSGVLKVTTFSYKRVKVLWWGQTPPVADDPALPTVTGPRTRFSIEGGGSGPFPIEQWIAAAKIPTPNIDVTIVYGRCVQGNQPACISSFQSSQNFIWLNPEFLGEPGKDTDYYRALFYRSLGLLLSREYLGPAMEDQFKLLLGQPAATKWGAYDSSIPWYTATPARLFGEAYSTCAWGGDRPAASVSFGFDRSHQSLGLLCSRVAQLIDGPKLTVSPIIQPPAPSCGAVCSTRLTRKVAWSTSLTSPASLVVVKFGKRFAVLPRGCSGTVRIGRAAVRLNYCQGELRAKSVGRGTPVIRYFNQPV